RKGRRMKIVYASDIHGQTSHYDDLLELASRESVRAVVLGGDLLPPPRGLSSPAGREDARTRQGEYLRAELLPRLDRARADGLEVLALLGNYDVASVADAFEEEFAARGHLTLHEKVRVAGGVTFAGLSWVNHTPFPLKDWETWDAEPGH